MSGALQLLSEVGLLVDHISANSCATLSDCTIDDPRVPGSRRGDPGDGQVQLGNGQAIPNTKMRIAEILGRVEYLAASLDEHPTKPLDPVDLTFLQLVRDRLVRMIRPASDLTIAYTTLITQRRGWFRASRGKARLARTAYPNLINRAWRHSLYHVAFLALAALFTFVAVDLSVEVATGKYILQTLDELHARRTTIVADEMRLETVLDNLGNQSLQPTKLIASGGSPDVRAFHLCDREKLFAAKASTVGTAGDFQKLTMDGSPSEREVCGRDLVLQRDFVIVHQRVGDWVAHGAGIVGGIFDLADRVWNWSIAWCSSFVPAVPSSSSVVVADADPPGDNIELKIPPTVLAIGNYVLPVVFGMLGSLLAVILDYYNKIRLSLLAPSDSWLSWIRLVLGVVVGACIGLFFTAYGPAIPPQTGSAGAGSALIASLTLSASGLAFLAGFGVEGVFKMLREVVDRVFMLGKDTRPASNGGRPAV